MLLIIIGLIVFLLWHNNAIGVSNISYVNPKLPENFKGYRILQVSDLHNKDFHGRLTKIIKEAKPDIIVITGDLIDHRKTNLEVAVEFIRDIKDIAPIYYVTGNHEQASKELEPLMKELEALGVDIIDNEYRELSEGSQSIGIMGIADPTIQQRLGGYDWMDQYGYVHSWLLKLLKDVETDFNILLSHRPEEFESYSAAAIDLVFSGHAHGGQIRIPFIGGVIAPHQGFFPKYTSGIYTDGTTSMVVSRGLGNSLFPLRVLNPPEVVVVTLSKE